MAIDSQSGYVEPASPNKYLDAEDTGRTVDGAPVVRQRTADIDARDLLQQIHARLLAITGTVGLDAATLSALENTTVTVANPTANPETGLAKEAKQDAAIAVLEQILAASVGIDLDADVIRQLLTDLYAELGQKLEAGEITGLSTAARQDAAKAVLDAIAGSLATDAKVEAVRALVETLRDTAYRRTDSLPAGTNNIGFVSPSLSQKVSQGRVNLAGSGRLTLALAGNVRAVFQNPAGSGKTISVIRIAGFSTGTGWAQILLNPTLGVPTAAARPALNAVAGGGVAAVGTLRVDTSTTVSLGGGTDTGIVIGMPANQRTQLDLPPIVLTPGVSMGINVPFAGQADSTLSIYWIED